MNILFITLLDIRSPDDHNIYSDLMREFARHNDDVYIVSPVERKNNRPTQLLNFDDTDLHKKFHILKVKIGNIQKTNLIEKGISTVLLEGQLISGIKKYFSGVKFDLVLYSTPPITLVKPIKFIKKRDNAKTYLMLKDIFPQNAIDMGMLSKSGVKGLIYKYFRNKEKNLYSVSDKIGCMSKANVDYVLKNNTDIPENKVEICPNCTEVKDIKITEEQKNAIREKYKIPTDKKVFVYGGNLGKPQGIPFIIECLKSQLDNNDAFFLIVGNGTEFGKLQSFFDEAKPSNMMLMQFLPVEEYDLLISACDVGMIFLDFRFTIPNYPSRLLGYMQAGLPVLAVTDKISDIGTFLEENGIGEFCPSNNVAVFNEKISDMSNKHYEKETINNVLKNEYSVEREYSDICRQICIERK